MSTALVNSALLFPLAATLLVFLAGKARPAAAAWSALGSAVVALSLLAGAALRTAPNVTLPWIPSWGIGLSWGLDGLSASYGLLTTAVAVLVLAYSRRYMRQHQTSAGRPLAELARFYGLFTLFMAAMIGLCMSLDLWLSFFFWDITTLCSYLLIAYDREQPEARRAAAMALRVTGISAVLLLVATLLLLAGHGTTNIGALAGAARSDALTGWAVALVIIAAVGKSALWPLHFWLPRAMAAPTPVSAYLHAAAMVAAGVFMLQRLQPLIEAQRFAGATLAALGLASMFGAGWQALREQELKAVLAHSTIAQYGHVAFLIGLGGAHGAAAATFFVVAHGLCKSALFMTAGAVTLATGRHRLDELGGLWRTAPGLALASAIAAAGVAGAPLTIGFFKDELLFDTALRHGAGVLVLSALGPGLTLAYCWRFWSKIFLGAPRREAACAVGESVPPSLLLPIAVVAGLAVLLGVAPSPIARAAERAAAATLGSTAIDPGYHLDLRPANLAALGALSVAAVLIALQRTRLAAGIDRALALPGPEALYAAAGRRLGALSPVLRRFGAGTLGARVAVVVGATAALVLASQAVVAAPAPSIELSRARAPAAAALLAVCAAAAATIARRQQLTTTLALSATTLALAAVFALEGAPDVALVLVLINVVSTLLIVALLYRVPESVLGAEQRAPAPRAARVRDAALALAGAALAAVVTWSALGAPKPDGWLGRELLAESETAHAANTVTATLVDFRGLDTLGELTVVVVSVLTVDILMRRARSDE